MAGSIASFFVCLKKERKTKSVFLTGVSIKSQFKSEFLVGACSWHL